MIDLDAIKARLAAVHAAGISVIHTRLTDHGIRVLVSMRDWSGNNRYDADTAVTTLIGNAPADIGALVAEVERLRGEAAKERTAEEDLVRVLRRVLDENKLREAHGEDTIGVLMKCGAFHDTEVAALAARIDAVEL